MNKFFQSASNRKTSVFNILAVVVVQLAVLFHCNNDVKYVLCLFGSMGYLDWLGLEFIESMSKCMAETSEYYLKRDFKAGEGSITTVHSYDCSSNFTFERVREETDNFRRPALCKGLLQKDNKCRNWSIDYFAGKADPDENWYLQQILEVEGNRRAFMKVGYPTEATKVSEAALQMKEGKPVYVSFDNFFLDKIKVIGEMALDKYFGDMKFFLNTLFISNFSTPTLGSPMHAASTDNFFFQCVGRKHWYFVAPHNLKYTSAYLKRGVTWVSNYANEKLIVDRLPIEEAIVEEGDMLYVPPFWLHAVGTPSGQAIAVANRVWSNAPRVSLFYDAMFYAQMPFFVGSLALKKLKDKLFGKFDPSSVTPITMSKIKNIPENSVYSGGFLPVVD